MKNINLSIIGSSNIINQHIEAAKKNNFKIQCVFSSRKNSVNLKKIQKNHNVKITESFKEFINISVKEDCHFILAGRLKDNEKYFAEINKYKKKILIEKPFLIKSNHFKKYLRFSKYLFIGFNRVYYDNLNAIKKKFILNSDEILVIIPEASKKRLVTNSCHIISMLIELFGTLKVKFKETYKNKSFTRCSSKLGNNINIIFNKNSVDNFKIESFSNKKKFILSPLENLKVFNDLIKVKKKNQNSYILKNFLNKKENNKLKPGFDNQYKSFKKFIISNKEPRTNINFAYEVIKTIERLF